MDPVGYETHLLLKLVSVHKDINKLVLQSGHDSVDTMFRHYHRGSQEVEALAFWALMPPQTETKIIRLPA